MAQQHRRRTEDGKLSESARHVVLPDGIVSTGFPAVQDTCSQLDIAFDPWQDGAARAILAKRADGLYAADTVAMSIPRQVGKTFLIGAIIFALCIICPYLTVIWTAHRFKTARETFRTMKGMCGRSRLAAHIEKVVLGAGDESIEFTNGSRILFGARERGFGRGFSEVDVLVLDEAQILSEGAMEDMTPATNQAENPLIILTGTPPRPNDPGEVFTNLRREALDGESEDTLYIEFSADRGADSDDRAQWAKANPSYPKRTPERAILRMKKNLPPESFLREALGIWDEEFGGGIFGTAAWVSCRVSPQPPPAEGLVLGVAVSIDLVWTSLGAAAAVDEGRVLLAAVDRRRGTSWVAAEVARIHAEWGCTVVIDGKGPGSPLVSALEDAGVEVTVVGTGEVCDASADLYDRVRHGTAAHMGHQDLDDAHAASVWRPVGERWAVGRRQSHDDVSMLEACTLAAWGVDREPVPAIF